MNIQKLKKMVITIGLLILMVFISGIVYADSMSAKLSIDSAKLKENTTYTLNASINEIESAQGIDTIITRLGYDTNIFDKTSISVSSINGWNPAYDEENGIIIIQKGDKTNKPEIFLTIHMKTKENIEKDSTTISLSGIEASGGLLKNGGTGLLKLGDLSLNIDKNIEEAENIAETSIDFQLSAIASTEESSETSNNSSVSGKQDNTNSNNNSNTNVNYSNTRKYNCNNSKWPKNKSSKSKI